MGVAYGAILLVGALVAGETALRLFEPKDPVRSVRLKIVPRMWAVWKRPVPLDPFSPPYRYAFNNAGADDVQRLNLSLKRMELGRGTWTPSDFLRDPTQAATFTVRFNALGFRGPERQVEKPSGTFRIIVLGTYQAFGHGVHDWETYAFYLEKFLNMKQAGGMRHEVWNLGRPGAPVITGWAQLSQRVMRYQPDLLIWDFGFNDLAIRNTPPGRGRAPKRSGRSGGFLRRVATHPRLSELRLVQHALFLRHLATNPWLSELRLVQHTFRTLFQVDRAPNLAAWKDVNARMIAHAQGHGLPVILLRHDTVAIQPASYQELVPPDSQVYFMDTTVAVGRAQATPEEVEEFWSKPTYLDEVGATREQVGNDSNAIYRTDALHYNRFGHRAIARVLFAKIAGLIESGAIRPAADER